MTAYAPRHAFDVYREPQPSLIALLFRRLRWQRKPAVPAGLPPAGADTGEFAALHPRVHSPECPAVLERPDGEIVIDEQHHVAVRRPVNGRSLGTQPRRHPELPETFDDRPGRDVLRRVLDGLRAMPVEATSRGGWQ